MPMTDIHCHMLPNMDDGSDELSESLQMARIAADSGVTTAILTPHCNHPAEEKTNYMSVDLRDAFFSFRAEVRAAGIPLTIMPGTEVLMTPEVPGLFRQRRLLTLAGSRYLLVEFFFDENVQNMNAMLQALAAEGCVPVIAHPERYYSVQDDPATVETWVRLGYGIQVNKGSILGHMGSAAELCSDRLLRKGLAHIVASDAHGSRLRTPELQSVREYISDIYSEDYSKLLLDGNPENILSNSPLNSFC